MRKNALLSEEVQELIDGKPHWIIRNGSLFFFLLLISVLAGTWFIRLPTAGHERLFDRIVGRHWISKDSTSGRR